MDQQESKEEEEECPESPSRPDNSPSSRKMRHAHKHAGNLAEATKKKPNKQFIEMNKRINRYMDYAEEVGGAYSKGDPEALVNGISKIEVNRKVSSLGSQAIGKIFIRLAGKAMPLPIQVGLEAVSFGLMQLPEVQQKLNYVSEMVAKPFCAGLRRCGLSKDDDENHAKAAASGIPPQNPPGNPPGTHPGDGHEGYGGVELSGPQILAGATHASESSVLLCFDEISGLLFQWAPGSDMAFTDFEMATTLRWLQDHKRAKVAFSLDPVDPQKHEAAGSSVEGLYQAKWYSHESLKSIPLGYWMWRADWKLKQLCQGALYHEASQQREPLRPGITVPADFPGASKISKEKRCGRRRCWIVCRSITLRPIGDNVVLIHPDDVRMGVEERAQTFNKARNSFEDSKVQPNEASPDVRYLDANYDAVAHFHPELLHCKRMAALLAVAEYLHKGPLRGESAFTMRKSSIPADFGDTSVPVIKFHHQGGLAEQKRCDILQQDLNDAKQKLQEASKRVEELRQEIDQAQHRLDRQRDCVDRYSQKSVDSYNKMVGETQAAVDRYNWQVKLHKEHAERANAIVAAFNESVQAYNKTNFSQLVFGGVDLDVCIKVDLQPVQTEEKEILKCFRPLAEEIHEHPETAGLLQSDVSLRPTSSVVEDIKSQEGVYLNAWPVANRPTLRPVRMAHQLRVVLHGLKAKPELNGCYGFLQSTEPVDGRYEIQVGTGANHPCRVYLRIFQS